MKAKKITVRIKIEVLSVDCVEGVLFKLANEFDNENTNGFLSADDGDYIEWKTESVDVEF